MNRPLTHAEINRAVPQIAPERLHRAVPGHYVQQPVRDDDRGNVWVRNFAFALSALTTIYFVVQLLRLAF